MSEGRAWCTNPARLVASRRAQGARRTTTQRCFTRRRISKAYLLRCLNPSYVGCRSVTICLTRTKPRSQRGQRNRRVHRRDQVAQCDCHYRDHFRAHPPTGDCWIPLCARHSECARSSASDVARGWYLAGLLRPSSAGTSLLSGVPELAWANLPAWCLREHRPSSPRHASRPVGLLGRPTLRRSGVARLLRAARWRAAFPRNAHRCHNRHQRRMLSPPQPCERPRRSERDPY